MVDAFDIIAGVVQVHAVKAVGIDVGQGVVEHIGIAVPGLFAKFLPEVHWPHKEYKFTWLCYGLPATAMIGGRNSRIQYLRDRVPMVKSLSRPVLRAIAVHIGPPGWAVLGENPNNIGIVR